MSDEVWEKFAQEDPYWAVLTEDRYRGRMDQYSRQAFFRRGESFVGDALDNFKRHFGRTLGATDSAIDFGCGVGRLTMPMARICRRVAGIDVSETMRAECMRNARRLRLRNVDCFADLTELAAGSTRFDWLSSHIVFQHLEVPLGYRLFDSLLKLLAHRAVISVHFTLFKDRRQAHYMTNSMRYFSVNEHGVSDYFPDGEYYDPNSMTMMMNDYRLERLVQILHANGFVRYFIEMEDQNGMHGAIIYSIKDA